MTLKLNAIGGGYVYPAGTQFPFFWNFLQENKFDASVVILSFSLAPGGQYPLQLKQAAGLLDWLLSHGKQPGDVRYLLDFHPLDLGRIH